MGREGEKRREGEKIGGGLCVFRARSRHRGIRLIGLFVPVGYDYIESLPTLLGTSIPTPCHFHPTKQLLFPRSSPLCEPEPSSPHPSPSPSLPTHIPKNRPHLLHPLHCKCSSTFSLASSSLEWLTSSRIPSSPPSSASLPLLNSSLSFHLPGALLPPPRAPSTPPLPTPAAAAAAPLLRANFDSCGEGSSGDEGDGEGRR